MTAHEACLKRRRASGNEGDARPLSHAVLLIKSVSEITVNFVPVLHNKSVLMADFVFAQGNAVLEDRECHVGKPLVHAIVALEGHGLLFDLFDGNVGARNGRHLGLCRFAGC